MRWANRVCAQMLVVMFGIAMSWASACSVMCVLGVCPAETMHFASHAGPQSSTGNAATSHHHEADPDCALHGHPSIFAEQAQSSPHLRPGDAGRLHVPAGVLAAFPFREMRGVAAPPGVSDLAPPGFSRFPLSQQIVVLRI